MEANNCNAHAGETTDRYVSFIGIPCDSNANELIACLDRYINTPGKGSSQWQEYFLNKRVQQLQMKHDNLYFIASQMNNLYSYFQECEDEEILDLLWNIEQECC